MSSSSPATEGGRVVRRRRSEEHASSSTSMALSGRKRLLMNLMERLLNMPTLEDEDDGEGADESSTE